MVGHDKSWLMMLEKDFPLLLVELLWKLCLNQKSATKVAGVRSEWLVVTEGGGQGCVVLSYLCNSQAEVAMRKVQKDLRGGLKIAGRLINNLRHAGNEV